MSTEMKPIIGRNGAIALTPFYGGKEDGACLQLTPWSLDGYIGLTKTQAYTLSLALAAWCQGDWPEEDENE